MVKILLSFLLLIYIVNSSANDVKSDIGFDEISWNMSLGRVEEDLKFRKAVIDNKKLLQNDTKRF